MPDLSMSQFVERTGIAEGTLRMWERRHGFPAPTRLESGHRRYSEADVELVHRVAADRSAGLSLSAAIARVKLGAAPQVPSVYAAVRKLRPDLEPIPLRRPMLLALTHAIEDESLSRAERPLLFASFQSERFYRRAERRWRELSASARLAFVFADFAELRVLADGPAEVPIDRGHPFLREWTVICCADGHAVCLSAWEPPGSAVGPVRDRMFEAIWSVEPDVIWVAARVCAEIVREHRRSLIDPVQAQLEAEPRSSLPQQLRLATAITSRAFSYIGG